MIDLNPRHLATVERILAEHAPGLEVRAFGSRATWTARDFSDLDLAIVGESRLDTDVIWRLKEAFSESDLPIRVDVLDWHAISDKFREAIEPDCVEVVAAASKVNWPEVTIGEIAEIVGGSTPSTKDPDNFGGDIPWLTPKDLSGPHDRYIARGERNLTQQGLDSCSAKLLPAGAVMLSTRAPVGYVAIAKNPIATNQGFRSLIAREGVSAEYLYYWLSVHTEELERHASGSTFRELSGSALKSITLRLPPVGEQWRIARVLGGLDDKIELNRRMAETLEEMARVLFRSWFVDFEPVRAKQEGRWRRGQSLPGLPAHLYEAFPDHLEPSELGPIPAGWRVAALGDVVELAGGGTPSTKRAEFWDGGEHCWATPRDLAALTSPVLLSTERKITDAGLAQISSSLLSEGTLLMSSRAPIGYLAIACVPVAINQGFIAITAKAGMSNLFMLNWCEMFRERIMTYANGSTFLEISKANFRQVPIVVPDAAVVEAFDTAVRGTIERLAAHIRESDRLAAQRDALLPRLLAAPLQHPIRA